MSEKLGTASISSYNRKLNGKLPRAEQRESSEGLGVNTLEGLRFFGEVPQLSVKRLEILLKTDRFRK